MSTPQYSTTAFLTNSKAPVHLIVRFQNTGKFFDLSPLHSFNSKRVEEIVDFIQDTWLPFGVNIRPAKVRGRIPRPLQVVFVIVDLCPF